MTQYKITIILHKFYHVMKRDITRDYTRKYGRQDQGEKLTDKT
jgi:hypothetical protein